MIHNVYYMAAFAAFLFCRQSRIPAAMCLLYMLTEWSAYELPNEEPEYLFQYYYLILCACAMLICFMLKYSENTKRHNIFMALFFIQSIQDFCGFLLYTYYQSVAVYNFAGNCIIISLLIALWITRYGKFEGYITMSDIFTRIRAYL